MTPQLTTAVTRAFLDSWKIAGAHSRKETAGGQKFWFCFSWDDGLIRDLQRFLPALEQNTAGCSKTVRIPKAAGSVSFSSGTKNFNTGQSLSSSVEDRGREILHLFFTTVTMMDHKCHYLPDCQYHRELGAPDSPT